MAKTITKVFVKDDSGKEIKFFAKDGYRIPKFFHTTKNLETIHEAIPDMKFRDDDVMLCSFPKTGSIWLFEVMTMILNKSAERVKGAKLFSMIEAQTQEMMEELPYPRVMNTHLNYRFLPDDMRVKQTKTVLICRNPKDAAVSFFNQMKGVKLYNYPDGEFKDWLRPFLNGEFEYGKYTDYLKEWEQAITSGVGFPLHVMYYEDMKLNGKEEIGKLCKFLDVDLDDKLKLDIMEASNFNRMSKEKEILTSEQRAEHFQEWFNFFRKGQIGDWKNWFTVQQNEYFDKQWAEEMKGSTKFEFTYEAKQ